jgi:hypothetical protein
VAARGDGGIERLGAVLREADVGRIEGEDAFVTVAAVRRLAEGVGDEWENDFQAMLDYAGTKGWLDESGAANQPHVEWA